MLVTVSVRSTAANHAMLGGELVWFVAIVSLVAAGKVHPGTLALPVVFALGLARVAMWIADVVFALVMIARLAVAIAMLPVALVVTLASSRRTPVPIATKRWKGVG